LTRALLALLAFLALSAGLSVTAAPFLTTTAVLSGRRLRDQRENPRKSKRAQA
jgi:hypothetical protein